MSDSDNNRWRDIAEQASKEQDSAKLLELAKQLEMALDADQQRRHGKKLPRANSSGAQKAG
jgi:hypothetical protein